MTPRSVVALDIGGTHASAGRVQIASSAVEERARAALRAGSSEDELLTAIVGAASAVATEECVAVGIAVPGPFDYDAGVSAMKHKLEPLRGVDLRSELSSALGLPTRALVFLNDAAAFLLGEWWAGAARAGPRAMGVTLGTGLGSAYLDEGKIVSGEGELYRRLFRGAPVEQTVSRAAIRAHYGSGAPDVEQIAARARDGETQARDVFDRLASDLAEFLAEPVGSFGPEVLVVGGSIAGAWDLLEDGLRAGLGRNATVVARAAHLEDAALLGAARHAWERTP